MSEKTPDKVHFFISYTKADRAWAEWIARELNKANYSTILDVWDFRPGSNFALEMDKATRQADRTIIVLSPRFLDARYPKAEWAAAFADDPTGEKRKLTPVRIADCEADGLLGQIVYIDLVGLDESEARQTLIDGLEAESVRRTLDHPFPGSADEPAEDRQRFPGALPPIWNVDHTRNANFTGRDETLEQLHEALRAGGRAAVTQAINGPGGFGKTQLAIEYAYRYASDYELVWWVAAE